MAVALDASMMLSWYFQDEERRTRHLLPQIGEGSTIVPVHWLAEVANGVLIGERRGRSASARVPLLMELLGIISPEIDDEGGNDAVARILPIARAHRLTVYDAIYLELAGRRGVPLATLDSALATAARSVGVEVLGA